MDFDTKMGVFTVFVALISGIVIYGISKITVKGYTSYDGIKASRRQEKSRSFNNEASVDAKKLKKMKKKLKKESMNSAAQVSSNEDNTGEEQDMVQLTQEQPLPETPSVVLIPQKIEEKPLHSTKVKNKVKPIKKVEEVEITSKQAQVYEKIIDSNFTKAECNTINEALMSLDNQVSNLQEEENTTSSDLNSKLKKKTKKKKGDGEESEKITLETILPLLKQAEFSHGEVQILIDALLNKDDSEWLKGKQDPMIKLKKQLEEMEKLHLDDAETIVGLQNKLAAVRSDMNFEKSSNKTFRDALAKANSDIHSLSFKLQQMAEEKESFHLNIQQLKQQLNDERIAVLKLKEEKMLYSQMNISHEQHHETVVALQAQVAQTNQLAAQLTEQQTHNANLAAQLDEAIRLEEECRQVNALNVELEHLLNNSQFEVNRLNSELVSLSKQLEDSRSQINDMRAMIEDKDAQKNKIILENENLKLEVSKAKQDARTFQKMANTLEHNLEENKKNGGINFHNSQSDYQSMLDEKELVIKNLNVELNQKEKAIEKLTNDIISCKNDANKKQTMIDNLSVELNSMKSLGAKTNTDLTEERSLATNLQASIDEKNEIINKLNKEIESCKHRNNELRSKNWKIVEALEKAEASIKDLHCVNAPANNVGGVNELKSRISGLIQPLITSSCTNIFNIEDNNIWLKQVEEIITNVKKENNSVDIVLQNSKLQNLVTHYRSVITDLEAMLSDLQNRIESANNQKSSSYLEVTADD